MTEILGFIIYFAKLLMNISNIIMMLIEYKIIIKEFIIKIEIFKDSKDILLQICY